MRNLRYVCAQPTTDYYTWQVEVMIHNFVKNGINPNNMDVVCGYRPEEGIPATWQKLAAHYNQVRFFFYEDTRKDPPYISSIRPHILKKHFAAHPGLQQEAIFYHDSDIAFTRPPDWSRFVEGEKWYASDCRFYIGAEYIEGKGHGIYGKMCEIVGIDPAIPRANQHNSGGAQYIMKNIGPAFWEKVESDSTRLWEFFVADLELHPEVKESEATAERPAYNPIQKWTADMWAVLWNGWALGNEILVVPEMEFVWATQEKALWDSRVIFHNAGVLATDAEKFFYKGQYTTKLPYDIKNTFADSTASHYYVKEILETAAKSCIWQAPAFDEKQLAFALKEEMSRKIDEICLRFSLSDATLQRWRDVFRDAGSGRMEQLESENAQLKRLVADLSLEKLRLEAAVKGAPRTD
jgi:hypothetical protein